jgi:hypothetical protein
VVEAEASAGALLDGASSPRGGGRGGGGRGGARLGVVEDGALLDGTGRGVEAEARGLALAGASKSRVRQRPGRSSQGGGHGAACGARRWRSGHRSLGAAGGRRAHGLGAVAAGARVMAAQI